MFYVYQVYVDVGSERLADELVLTNLKMLDFDGVLLYSPAVTGADIFRRSICRQALFQAGQFVNSGVNVNLKITLFDEELKHSCEQYSLFFAALV